MGSCLSSESRGSPLPVSASGVRKRKALKRRASRNASFNFRLEEQLHSTPGRMFFNGSSENASLYTKQGKKGTNQDAMIVWENFGLRTDTVFCGVFDGHGPYGHMVAKQVRDSLPLKLSAQWEVNLKSEEVLREVSLNTGGSLCPGGTSFFSVSDDDRTSNVVDETGKHSDVFQTLKESFLNAFKVMDRELRVYTNIDCFCSGTTAVTLVKQGQDLVIGNIGDSRAVLATRDENNSLIAVQLTVDLKPNLPAEEERIRRCKGRVFPLRDEPEVSRLWLPNYDSPGLAMARAFGDFCLKDFGLISVPEVSYRRITNKDEFIVLATDGIWDVLTNKDVVDIVSACPSRPLAARTLVESAARSWRSKYPTSKVDDCAVVCLFFDSTKSTGCANISKENIPSTEHDLAPTAINRSGTVRNSSETLAARDADASEPNKEAATDTEQMNTEISKEWSALEGVSRINTLLTLPRFLPGRNNNKSTSETKAKN